MDSKITGWLELHKSADCINEIPKKRARVTSGRVPEDIGRMVKDLETLKNGKVISPTEYALFMGTMIQAGYDPEETHKNKSLRNLMGDIENYGE